MTMSRMPIIPYQTGPRAGQQIAARRQQAEREHIAEDLARWAAEAAGAAHDADVEAGRASGARHYTYCCEHAREDAARNMYAFALELPLAQLRARHLAELTERAASRATASRVNDLND